jgi:hypothetical protein
LVLQSFSSFICPWLTIFTNSLNEAQVAAFDFSIAGFLPLIDKIMMGEAINLDIEIPSNFFSGEALTVIRQVMPPNITCQLRPPHCHPSLSAPVSGKGKDHDSSTHTNPNLDGEISQPITLSLFFCVTDFSPSVLRTHPTDEAKRKIP